MNTQALPFKNPEVLGPMGFGLPQMPEINLQETLRKPFVILGSVATLGAGLVGVATYFGNTERADAVVTCPNPDANFYPSYTLPDFSIPLSSGVDLRTYANGLGKPGNNWMCTGNLQVAKSRFSVINYGNTTADGVTYKFRKSAPSNLSLKNITHNLVTKITCNSDPVDPLLSVCTTSQNIPSMQKAIVDLEISANTPSWGQNINISASSANQEMTPEDNSAQLDFDVHGIDYSHNNPPPSTEPKFRVQALPGSYLKLKKCQQTLFYVFVRQGDVYKKPILRGTYRARTNSKPKLITRIMPKVYTIASPSRFPLKVNVCKGDLSPTIAVQFGATGHKTTTLGKYRYLKNKTWKKVPIQKVSSPQPVR